jgi:hypothetical protein
MQSTALYRLRKLHRFTTPVLIWSCRVAMAIVVDVAGRLLRSSPSLLDSSCCGAKLLPHASGIQAVSSRLPAAPFWRCLRWRQRHRRIPTKVRLDLSCSDPFWPSLVTIIRKIIQSSSLPILTPTSTPTLFCRAGRIIQTLAKVMLHPSTAKHQTW